jgi:hypothetical protein
MTQKLTDKQREVLRLMADGVHTLHHNSGMGNYIKEYFHFRPTLPGRKFCEDRRTIRALEKRGLIHYGDLSDGWRSRKYIITDAGRAALAEGQGE